MKKMGLTCMTLFVVVLTFATCRVDTVLTYKYDPGLSTKKLERIDVKHYNAANLIDTNVNFQKNTSGAWVKFARSVYTYNAANLSTEILNQGFDTTSQQWKNGNRTNSTYDGANNLSQRVVQNWNAALMAWENNYQEEYTYNANKKPVTYHSRIWSSSVWVNEFFDSVYYTPTNKQLLKVLRNWNTTTNIWEPDTRYTYYYAITDSLTEVDLEYYNKLTGLWKNGFQDVYTYNTNNTLVTLEKRKWEDAIFDYANYFKELYAYTAQNWLENRTQLIWNTTTNSFDNYAVDSYEYYTSGDLSAQEEYRNWLPAGSYYRFRTRYEYKCIAGTVAIDNVANESTLSIYPNPLTTGFLTVESNEIQPILVMDISGKVILESDLQKGENKLDVRHLSSGMYLVKTKQQTQKLVIE